MNLSDRVKAEVSLRQVAEDAGVEWDLRKSRTARGDWWGPCPLHHEKTSSFHVVEKGGSGGFFKCFGCHEGGTVIDFVMQWQGVDFTTAVRRLAQDAGIAGQMTEAERQALERKRAQAKADQEREAEAAAQAGQNRARALWKSAKPAAPDGLLARYLTARGVDLAALGGVPSTLRGARLSHWDGGFRKGEGPDHIGPAMVAAIGRDTLLGVHRTWISASGRARHADGRKVEKQWIGRTGAMMGQPCVLSKPTGAVVVGEGIETTLAAFSALLADGRLGWSAEAGLSRGAITGPGDASQLWTPRPGVSEVLLLGEGSRKDPRQARELYEGAQARLEALGLRVLLTVPRGRWDLDLDFADVAAAEIVKG